MSCDMTTPGKKPLYQETLRLDIKYFRDGSCCYRFMRPDGRKRNHRDFARNLKWEWAIGSGYDFGWHGGWKVWNQRAMSHLQFQSDIPHLFGSLGGHIAYTVRALLHDLEEPGRPWIKKWKKLRGTDNSVSPDSKEGEERK